jgi:hypothetical protein
VASHAHVRRSVKLFTGQSISTISLGSCLNIEAKHNVYSDSAINTIIEAVPEMVTNRGCGHETPLSALCGRYSVKVCCYDDGLAFYNMFYSLLELDFSDEVIESPPIAMLLKDTIIVYHLLRCCFKSTD